MPDIMDRFRDVPSEKYDKKGDVLLAYEAAYLKLLKDYDQEIREIKKMQAELIKEKKDFIQTAFPEMEAYLKKIEYINPDTKAKWIVQVYDSMMKSFDISDDIIDQFVRKSLDEFRNKLDDELKKVLF